tara:strand:+ start:313 stop:513 length:201 start_codon:yes stop_codon:yes gene_type:complete
MIEIPLYPDGYPCKCSGACNYSKAFENAGKPSFIDYEIYLKKDFITESKQQELIHDFLNTRYCLNK